MDEFDYDAVIVGAGPIGGYLAKRTECNTEPKLRLGLVRSAKVD